MYRQSPGRNHRSKGVRVKNVLQICLLLAVCFWLIYQVKHSHDKKKEFDESDAKLQRTSSDEFIRLGRKDIVHQVGGTITRNENHEEPSEEEENNVEVVEENKHEEAEPEDKKVEGREDDGMGGGDDETDEHEQEKSDEVDREDLVDGEEREDGDENEIQETDSEDGRGQIEKESTAEDTDHDGDERSTHEAREEHYKADDASSAVTQDTQTVTTDSDNERLENSNQRPEIISEEENKESNSEETYKSENRKDLEVEGGEVATDGRQSNVTVSETKIDLLDNSENGSSTDNTVIERSNDHLTSNSTTEVAIENHDLPSENVTESKPQSGHEQGNLTDGMSAEGSGLRTIDSERANNSILNVDGFRFDSNLTGSAETKNAESLSEEFSNLSNNSTVSSASENVLISEASTEAGNNTESSSEKNNEVEGENSDATDGTDESLETTLTENPEEVQQDGIDMSDTSNSMEEKDVRMDLDTLPEIQTEGTNDEDAATE